MGKYVRLAVAFMASVSAAGLSAPASAQVREASYAFDLPAQPLADALRAVATQAGLELYAPADAIIGLTAPRLAGRLTAREAIDQLLVGTALRARFDNGAVIVRLAEDGVATASIDEEAASAADIVVTGSRIEGAPPTAPVTTITSSDIAASGYADLGEIARSLPQSFGGGQNPGIGNGQGVLNENANVNGASTFNLRGIGSNATLTLLNGNRLSYSGASAAIDISSIPVAAVERVEIVTDGASAIYGADAVGGVVNIILRRDFEGVAGTARIGASTDGGNVQQHHDIVGGTRWGSGGVIAAYDYFRNSEISAGDRSYAGATNPEATLYPDIRRRSLLLSGHQALGSSLTLRTDAIFKTGRQQSASGLSLTLPVTSQGLLVRRDFETFGIAPSLEIELPGRWSATVTATYGTDKTQGETQLFLGGALFRTTNLAFENSSRSLEVGAQGPLFALPAGDVRLAFGAGARRTSFFADLPANDVSRRRTNHFAYGELFVPLIAPEQDSGIGHRLFVTGALRVEDYSDSSRIATPKLGLSYEPVEGFTLQASWGRSFKLPTLFQQYSGYSALLLPVEGYGSLYPQGATYIELLGANSEVGAERSRNMVFSALLEPTQGLDLTVSYFDIAYTDRVAPPVSSSTGALTNPLYANLITVLPSGSTIDAVAAAATAGLQNLTDNAYDPASVIAILDARDRNIARQRFQGVDVAVSYRTALGDSRSILVSGGATMLDSAQRLNLTSAWSDLSGTIFNPPTFKARGGVSYEGGPLSASAFINYSGGVRDNRTATMSRVRALATMDVTARYRIGEHVEFSLTALNLLNTKPQAIVTSSPFDTPFDTTNASAVGRFVGAGVTARW